MGKDPALGFKKGSPHVGEVIAGALDQVFRVLTHPGMIQSDMVWHIIENEADIPFRQPIS